MKILIVMMLVVGALTGCGRKEVDPRSLANNLPQLPVMLYRPDGGTDGGDM